MAKFEPHAEYTDAELLQLVKAAIATVVVTGQSYTIRGRVFMRADLDDLYALRLKLEAQINAATSTRQSTNVVKFVRPQ